LLLTNKLTVYMKILILPYLVSEPTPSLLFGTTEYVNGLFVAFMKQVGTETCRFLHVKCTVFLYRPCAFTSFVGKYTQYTPILFFIPSLEINIFFKLETNLLHLNVQY